MNDRENLYQELIIEHHKNPKNRGELEECDCSARLINPLCGDHVSLSVNFKKNFIAQIMFSGKGCSISQASASMMCELCEGVTIEAAQEFLRVFTKMLSEQISEGELCTLGDASCLEGVRKFPARIRCAMLGWEALSRCLKDRSDRESS